MPAPLDEALRVVARVGPEQRPDRVDPDLARRQAHGEHEPAHLVGAAPAAVVGIAKRDAGRRHRERLAARHGHRVEHLLRARRRDAAGMEPPPGPDRTAPERAQPAHQPGQSCRPRLGERRQRRQIAVGPRHEGAHVDDVVGFVVGDDQYPAVAQRRAQSAFELGEVVADAAQRVAGVRVAEANVEAAVERPQVGDAADVGDQQPGDRRGDGIDLEVGRLTHLAQPLEHLQLAARSGTLQVEPEPLLVAEHDRRALDLDDARDDGVGIRHRWQSAKSNASRTSPA